MKETSSIKYQNLGILDRRLAYSCAIHNLSKIYHSYPPAKIDKPHNNYGVHLHELGTDVRTAR